MLKIIIHLGILISILSETKIKYRRRKSVLTIIAPYPSITNVPSSQGSGKICSVLPSCVLCDSIYQNNTANKKHALQRTVILEKKRKTKVYKVKSLLESQKAKFKSTPLNTKAYFEFRIFTFFPPNHSSHSALAQKKNYQKLLH